MASEPLDFSWVEPAFIVLALGVSAKFWWTVWKARKTGEMAGYLIEISRDTHKRLFLFLQAVNVFVALATGWCGLSVLVQMTGKI